MRVGLFLSLFILLAVPLWAFEAEVITSLQAPNGVQATQWQVRGDHKGMCLGLAGQDDCLAEVTYLPQGAIVSFGGQEKELRGSVLFDENAEAPWNILKPDFMGSQQVLVRVLATGLDLSRVYDLECASLPMADLELYGVKPLANQEYKVVRVYRGQNIIAEQVWIEGQDFWLLDIRGEQRSVRVEYAP